jgi:hypothetical protein
MTDDKRITARKLVERLKEDIDDEKAFSPNDCHRYSWEKEIGVLLSVEEAELIIEMHKELQQPPRQSDGVNSYMVFEDSQEQDGLVQLSVILPSIERAREFVKSRKNKRLYIFMLVE